MSLKNRLLITFSLIVILSLLLPFLSYRKIFQRTLSNEARSDAIRQFQNVEWILQQEEQLNNFHELSLLLQSIGRHLDIRVSYIGSHGEILADSLQELDGMDRFAYENQRSEVRQAREGDMGIAIRFDPLTRDEHIFVAQQVRGIGNFQPGILRVAMSYSLIRDQFDQWSGQLINMFVLCIVLTGFFSWLFARQFQKQIQKISSAAEAIGQGDFQKRVDFYPALDFVPLVRGINRMAKSIQKQIETIFDQKQELQAIFNGLREGVLVLDRLGRVRKYNKAIHDIFHLSYSVQGLDPIEFVRSPELQGAYQKMKNDPSAVSQKILIKLFGTRYFDVTLIPLKIKENGQCETICVFHDVSELKRLEQVRKDFVANVSHELRTPLTSIKGYAETLLSSRTPDAETLHSFMKVIQKNANNMNQMLEDLLQLARLESTAVKQDLGTVNMNLALVSAWEVCKPHADEKYISLDNRLPQECSVLSDYDQIVRVLINLLDNAIKYSPNEESIIVSASQKDKKWCVSVEDVGPGIPLHEQNRVFERFYRADSQSSGPNQIMGTGLGLAICKHIIVQHGGTIWVESPKEGALNGTIIHFCLQRKKEMDKNDGFC
jgi:two-component system phosphate regulon sensor histidine kinase PhoR